MWVHFQVGCFASSLTTLCQTELATADYKGLRDKMKNIRILPNATIKPTQHFEHDICTHNHYTSSLKCVHIVTLVWARIYHITHTIKCTVMGSLIIVLL